MGTVRIKDHWAEQRLFERRAVAAAVIIIGLTLVQQSLFVFAMLTLNEFVVWVIEGWIGHPVATPWRWIQPMIGGMLWPFVALLLGRTHSRA